MVTQKYYGFGNLIRMLKPNYIPKKYKNYIQESHENNLDIFLLAGQSNMEGDGEDFIPSLNDGKIYVFNENYKWVIGREPIRNKYGPSMAIASVISERTEKPIGIINVARGGTNIIQWQKNYNDNSLYQKTLKRAFSARAQGEIKGLFFLQGENDAEGDQDDKIDDWHVYFGKFIKDIRTDLANDSLPVVFGQIGKTREESDNSIRWDRVKLSQSKVDINNVVMIKTDDIDYHDGVHYSSDGYRKLGIKFGEEYIKRFILNN